MYRKIKNDTGDVEESDDKEQSIEKGNSDCNLEYVKDRR